MDELWKDIPGYEGIYEASTNGQIRSKAGKTTFSSLHGERHWKQRILKQKLKKRYGSEYFDARIILWKDKKTYTHLVSRLVAMTWCNGYADDMTVNHIDGNPMNNHADNLEWVSGADNTRKGFEDGLIGTSRPVAVFVQTGECIYFRSMTHACNFIGKNHGFLSLRISKMNEHVGPNDMVYYDIPTDNLFVHHRGW